MEKEFYTIKQVAEKLNISTNGVMLYIKRNNLTNLLTTVNGVLVLSNNSYNKLVNVRKEKQEQMQETRVKQEPNIPNIQANTSDVSNVKTVTSADVLKQIKEYAREYAEIFINEKDKQIKMLQDQIKDLQMDLKSKDVVINNLIANNNNLIANNTEQIKAYSISQLALQKPSFKQRLLNTFSRNKNKEDVDV